MEDSQPSTLSRKGLHTETQMNLITAAGGDYIILQVSYLILYIWLLGVNLVVEILGEIKQVQMQLAHQEKASLDETCWGRQPGWPWRAVHCVLPKGSMLTWQHSHHQQLYHHEPLSDFNHNLLIWKACNLPIYYDYFLAYRSTISCSNKISILQRLPDKEDTQFDNGKTVLVKHQK